MNWLKNFDPASSNLNNRRLFAADLKLLKVSDGKTVSVRYSINERCGSTFPLATQYTGTARMMIKKRIRMFEKKLLRFMFIFLELGVNERAEAIGKDG